MRISAQTIVFNAESILPKGMLRKNIEETLKFADELIIVEGATHARTGYFDGNALPFTNNGRSTDTTIQVIEDLKAKYPDKIKLVLGSDDGFWNGKTAMCNAAAQLATGDYLWQVDSDEFYHENELPIIIKLLEEQKPDAVHFFANHFYGGYEELIGNDQPWGNGIPWMRIFRHTPGSHWISHEPPNYQLADGLICNRGIVITREQTNALGLKMYHYGYVMKEQVDFKAQFYGQPTYPTTWEKWKLDKVNTRIFGSKTSHFEGTHPACIREYLG